MDEPYLGWVNSPHADITCVGCHPGSLESDLRHAWLGLVKKVETIEGEALVDEQACVRCHVEGDNPRWPAVAATAGHRVHEGKADKPCVSCHGSRIHHVKRGASEVCIECHGEELMLGGMVGRVHCLDCHNFLAESSDLAATAETCRGCHAPSSPSGAPVPQAHGTLDCLECHGPHDPPDHRTEPCNSCHEQLPSDHAPHEAACGSCHTAHHPAQAAQHACGDCHDRPAHKGHLVCSDCHASHHEEDPKARCTECHEMRKGLHGNEAHQQCLTCHRPHGATRPDERQCLACHGDALDGHASRGCIGCHTFRKEPKQP